MVPAHGVFFFGGDEWIEVPSTPALHANRDEILTN